jgi:hypothetical protein
VELSKQCAVKLHGFYTPVFSDEQDVPPIEGYQECNEKVRKLLRRKETLILG